MSSADFAQSITKLAETVGEQELLRFARALDAELEALPDPDASLSVRELQLVVGLAVTRYGREPE